MSTQPDMPNHPWRPGLIRPHHDVFHEIRRRQSDEIARAMDARIMDPHPFDGPWPPEPKGRAWVFMRRFDILGADGSLYMRRWRLFECPWFGVLLHRIVRPDKDADLHDHPWSFVSILLRGIYVEQFDEHPSMSQSFTEPYVPRPPSSPRDYMRIVRWLNVKRAGEKHRIAGLMSRVGGAVWTLVLHGPDVRTWGFHTKWGSSGHRRRGWVPWHVYLGVDEKEKAVSKPRPRTER